MQVNKKQLEPCMEQLIGARLRKEYDSLLSPCLFNLYAEHIMRNAGLDKLQAGIKIGGKNINNLRYAESEENLKNIWWGERGEWKSWLKTQQSKIKIMASGSITSWQIKEEKMEAETDFIFLGSKITVDSACSHEIKRHLLLEGKVSQKAC